MSQVYTFETDAARRKRTYARRERRERAAAALTLLSEAMTEAARNPAQEFLRSLPTWQKAGNEITTGVIGNIQSALHDLMTGNFSWDGLADALLGTLADALAPLATGELLKVTGLDRLLDGMADSIGGLGSTDMTAGSITAGQNIGSAMIAAGQQVSAQLQSAMTGAGAQAGAAVRGGIQTGGVFAGTNIRTAGAQAGNTLGQGVVSGAQQAAPILTSAVASGAAGGSAGGGILDALGGWGGIAGMVLGAFSEGGYVTQPVGRGSACMTDFMNAPHFSEGGLTPGSVPVIAHENEAIVPLSRNRSIPVELAGNAGGGSTVQNIYMTVNGVTDADSFRRSRGQVESDLARAGQRSLGKNG